MKEKFEPEDQLEIGPGDHNDLPWYKAFVRFMTELAKKGAEWEEVKKKLISEYDIGEEEVGAYQEMYEDIVKEVKKS
ncbi:MAG: hypothetical protein HY602_01595 [Parcubacteria group bacterium]|nr:hypothetical protein [Parcubacteria group bacterium]